MPNQTAWANVVLTYGANTNTNTVYIYANYWLNNFSYSTPFPPLNTPPQISKEIDEIVKSFANFPRANNRNSQLNKLNSRGPCNNGILSAKLFMVPNNNILQIIRVLVT